MDYIFTIGEPFVAIFAGYFLFHFTRKHLAGTRRLGAGDLTPVASGLILLMGFTAISAVGLQHSYATLKQQAGDYQVYELPELETVRLVEQIRRNSKPDGLILAPPHYAFLAQRRIAEDYSELYLWSIKYHNERFDKVEARGVKTALRIAELLRAGKIDYVVLDMNQTGNIPEIREALEQSYTPQRKELFRSLNTPLQFYKPK